MNTTLKLFTETELENIFGLARAEQKLLAERADVLHVTVSRRVAFVAFFCYL